MSYFDLNKDKGITLELVPNKTNLPVIKMRIAGEWMHFIVDTGAMGSLVSPAVIANRNLKQIAKARCSGIGEGIESIPVYSTQFNLLGISISAITVTPTFGQTFAKGHDYGVTIHGLIGQDVLGQFSSYTINNKKQTITFNK